MMLVGHYPGAFIMKIVCAPLMTGLLACLTPLAVQSEVPPRVIIRAIDAMPQGRASDGRGIMTDAAMEAARRAGLDGVLEFIPWKRAQQEVTGGRNQLITALARTPEREDKYTWIFPVFRYGRAFVTMGRKFSSFAEARVGAGHIAVEIGSSQYDMLIREGFSPEQLDLIPFDRQASIPVLLLKGRVDAWFAATAEARHVIKGLAGSDRFTVGPTLGGMTEQYLACSRDCDSDLVDRLRKAGAEMLADGTMAAIVRRYQ